MPYGTVEKGGAPRQFVTATCCQKCPRQQRKNRGNTWFTLHQYTSPQVQACCEVAGQSTHRLPCYIPPTGTRYMKNRNHCLSAPSRVATHALTKRRQPPLPRGSRHRPRDQALLAKRVMKDAQYRRAQAVTPAAPRGRPRSHTISSPMGNTFPCKLSGGAGYSNPLQVICYAAPPGLRPERLRSSRSPFFREQAIASVRARANSLPDLASTIFAVLSPVKTLKCFVHVAGVFPD